MWRIGADRDCSKPQILISATCNVTVNSEIRPKSCAYSQRATAMAEKSPQPAATCGKVIVTQAQAGISAASFCSHNHFMMSHNKT